MNCFPDGDKWPVGEIVGDGDGGSKTCYPIKDD